MFESIWFSSLLGVLIGGAYSLSSYLTVRMALPRKRQAFMMLVMGGMAVRIFITVLILALLLALAPLHRAALVIGFFISFFTGLILEIRILHRRTADTERPANPEHS